MSLPERYDPTGEVASGGFGSVKFCNDKHLDRPVAIKFIQDSQEMGRLMDELSALMQMRSKHVVQVYDIIYDKASPAGIVEEFISGDDLLESDLPQSSLEEYLRVLWQIASGISDVHDTGIIHRDIKPNNMKIDDEGVLKIYDFGLARDVGADAATFGFKGTFCFAAPELFSGGDVVFTQAIDVYAFGVTACYLMDKSLPPELMKAPPVPASKYSFKNKPMHIPDELDELFLSCLDHTPDNRPAISKVRDLIARYLLRNKHQALAVFNGKPNYLNSANKNIGLKFGNIGEIEIEYDGLCFFVKSVSGEVFINNRAATISDEINGSCVVALGASYRPYYERAYITFDISHPEVVL